MGFASLGCSRSRAGLLTLAAILLGPAAARAQTTYTWNNSAGSSWQTAANWLPNTGTPSVAGDIAVFGSVATGSSTVTLASDVTIGELRFADVNTGSLTPLYTVGTSARTITFDNLGSPGLINVVGQTRTNQTIAASISAAGGQPLIITNNGAPGMTTLTLSGGLSATTAGTALTVGGQSNTTISGVIGGNFGPLTKNGSGVLLLSAGGSGNTYVGGTVINGGIVSVSNNNQLGATTGPSGGSVTLDGGAILFSANSFGTTRNFVINANGGTFLTTAAPNFFGQSAFLGGSISNGTGNGPVTFDGGQYLELRANNTYTGPTIINDAGLQLTNNGQLSATSSITINGFNSGRVGILDMLNGGAPNNNRLNDLAPITLNGGVLSYLPGTSTPTTEVLGDLTVKGFGALWGNHSLSGPSGMLTFGALNRFDDFSTLYVGGTVHGPQTGSVQIMFASGLSQSPGTDTQIPVVPWIGGDLGLSDGSNIHATAIPETLYTYNDDFGLQALTSANYVLTGSGVAMQANRNISLQGNPADVTTPLSILALIVDPTAPATGVTIGGNNTLTIANAAIANTLPLVFNGPTLAFGGNTGYLWLGDNLTIQGSSQITGTNGLVVSSSLPDSLNANSLKLRNTANTFTGGLYLNGSAQVDFNLSDAQLGDPGQVISFRGGTLHYSGTTSIVLSTLGMDRPLVMSAAGGGVINVEDLSVTLTVPSQIIGNEQLTKVGGGTLLLANVNNIYAGGTTLAQGTLTLAGPGSVGTGDLIVGRTGSGPVTLRLNSGGTYAFNINHAAQSATFDTNGNNATFSGAISGNGTTITKTGLGTLTLTGANTNTSNTVVSGGTLLANNTSGFGTGYGSVTVNSGGTIGGTGTIAGPITVSAGKLLTGGSNGLGQLTILGKATLSGAATYLTTLAGNTAGSGFGQLIVKPGGSIALGAGTTIFSPTLSYTPAASDKLFLIVNQNASGGLTGTFNGLAEGAIYTFGDGTKAQISYLGDSTSGLIGSGNDLVLFNFVPVPEPAAVFGIAAAALGVIGWRRRKAVVA